MKLLRYLPMILFLLALLSFTAVAFQPVVDTLHSVPVPPLPVGFAAILPWILWGLSEIFALVPSMKSNSILQLIFNIFMSLNVRGNQPKQAPPVERTDERTQ